MNLTKSAYTDLATGVLSTYAASISSSVTWRAIDASNEMTGRQHATHSQPFSPSLSPSRLHTQSVASTNRPSQPVHGMPSASTGGSYVTSSMSAPPFSETRGHGSPRSPSQRIARPRAPCRTSANQRFALPSLVRASGSSPSQLKSHPSDSCALRRTSLPFQSDACPCFSDQRISVAQRVVPCRLRCFAWQCLSHAGLFLSGPFRVVSVLLGAPLLRSSPVPGLSPALLLLALPLRCVALRTLRRFAVAFRPESLPALCGSLRCLRTSPLFLSFPPLCPAFPLRLHANRFAALLFSSNALLS